MKYELPKEKSGYFPEVLFLLACIDNKDLNHERHNLSHPADLFLQAFNDVIECSTRVLNRIKDNNLNQRVLSNDIDSLRIDIFNLLFYSSNFIESCQSIIKSLFEVTNKNKEFSSLVREFNKSTEKYRAHTSKIINAIKHQHRRIRPFSFSWEDGLIIGYFVEGLLAPNIIGPDPQIHPKYAGLNTGISLNKEIPYHLVHLYFVSACLSTIVRKRVKPNSWGIIKNLSDEHVFNCLKEAADLDFLLLPDELSKDIPKVSVLKKQKMKLEMPSGRLPRNIAPHEATVSLDVKIGLSNRTVAPPYMLIHSD